MAEGGEARAQGVRASHRSATPAEARRRQLNRRHSVVAGVVAFLIPWHFGFAPEFVYDAAQYWGGAAAIVAGGDPVLAGGLATRGIFTTFVYLPPALVAALIGQGAAVWSVLAWNALLAAVVCVVLVPRLAGLFGADPTAPTSPSRIWTAAVLGPMLLAGFARYPLVDVWATSIALAGVCGLVVARRWWVLLLSGAALLISVNMRPALIAAVAIAVVVLLFARPFAVVRALAGAAIAVLPQVYLNLAAWGSWSIVPRETGPLSAVQAAWAPYAIRYDTVAFAEQAPQQWYCDPGYAALVINDQVPTNQLGVVGSAFEHLPASIWFLFRKAAASLQWSFSTPYGDPPADGVHPMAILVIGVSAGGLVALIACATTVRRDRVRFVPALALLGFWFGALGTLVFATPETRFALPLVLVGLVGLVAIVPKSLRRPARSTVWVISVVIALALAVALLAAGCEALGHALPPGPLQDAAGCARE